MSGNVGKTWNSKVHFIYAVMLELIASLKVVSGRQKAQAVKYCDYILVECGKMLR
jgi:hypothetical protein